METTHDYYRAPATDDRVTRHSSDQSNARIRERTVRSLQPFVGAPRSAIDARIAELRGEWDIERTLEANASAVALVGAALGVAVDKRFFAIPALVAGFLFQHATQGWCPPLPVFRRLGVRTSAEIHAEILALRILRDDFSTKAIGAEAALSQALSQ
jgi:hypothetical protein